MPTAKLAKAAAAVTATVLLLEFAARCEGALAVSGHQMVTWWGSNRAWRETPQMQERSLGELCSSSPFTVINLAYMVDHFSTRGLPALDFAFHCNGSSSPYPGFETASQGPTLLKCPDIETDILLCQSLGKRVLLSVSPYHETLASDGDGIRSAEQVWNVFLNGQSPFRPFGRAVLDGVDLYQRTNEKGYTAFAIRLRQLMDSDTTKQYLLSVSPECAFPSARVGPVYENTLLASAPQIVDYVNVMHLATQVCSFGSVDRIGFWNTVRQWNTWAKGTGTGIRFITGLPSWGWGFESWVNGMVGDFIYPDDLGNVTQTLNSLEAFAGVGLYDASYEFNNIPCEDRQERYSQIIDAMLSTAGSTGELGCRTRTSPPIVSGQPQPQQSSRTTAVSRPTGSTRQPNNATCSGSWWCSSSGSNGGEDEQLAPQQSGLSTGAISGIAVGCGALVLVGAGAILYTRRRKARGRTEEEAGGPKDGSAKESSAPQVIKKSSSVGPAPFNRSHSRIVLDRS